MPTTTNYWVVRAPEEIRDDVERGCFIGIGFGGTELGDLSNLTKVEIGSRVESRQPRPSNPDSDTNQLYRFVNEIKQGDLVLVPLKGYNVFHIGKVTGDYTYNPALPPLPHRRSVRWLRRGLSNDVLNFNFRWSTISNVDKHQESINLLVHESDEGRNLWDEYVRRARQYVNTGRLESEEIEYKVEIGRKLAAAREAVLAGAEGWSNLVESGIPSGNPLTYFQKARIKTWLNDVPDEALRALRAIWTQGNLSVSNRVRTFSGLFPVAAMSKEGLAMGTSGVGSRTSTISVLLMGVDVEQYPPFRIRLFDRAYDRTGYAKPEGNADEAALYEHALGFLDRFIEEAAQRGLSLRHRLDAQSVVWGMPDNGGGTEITEVDDEDDQPTPEPVQPDLQTLAANVHLPVDFLEEIVTLLEDKKQVIFQGPPGTGKTYVAQDLAKHLAGSEERVTLVQFHPSYAYEDFVRGFRPMLRDGQPGFELRDGPLLEAAKRARDESGAKHFLVIDEINRGNIAKVFGELYFLLEYRGKKMRLQYQRDGEGDFSLPGNLYIIGTMNTADRSIALVDLALRRRFYFMEFHPDEEPVKSVLEKWLMANAPDMEWVVSVVQRANELLKDDRHAAIGPSYFMKPGLDEAVVERVWKHSVLPYIEERLFVDRDGLDEFHLDRLRRSAAGGGQQDEQTGSGGAGGDGGVAGEVDPADMNDA